MQNDKKDNMKKVGIFTFPRDINYGDVLNAYAPSNYVHT